MQRGAWILQCLVKQKRTRRYSSDGLHFANASRGQTYSLLASHSQDRLIIEPGWPWPHLFSLRTLFKVIAHTLIMDTFDTQFIQAIATVDDDGLSGGPNTYCVVFKDAQPSVEIDTDGPGGGPNTYASSRERSRGGFLFVRLRHCNMHIIILVSPASIFYAARAIPSGLSLSCTFFVPRTLVGSGSSCGISSGKTS